MTLPKLKHEEKGEHRNLRHFHFFPTTLAPLFVRSVLRQSTSVGSANKIQVRFPVPFLRSRCTSQQQLAGLSAGSHVLGEPVAEYISLMNPQRLSLTGTAFA